MATLVWAAALAWMGATSTFNDVDAEVASVLPTAEEQKWLTVSWRTNLFGARKEAHESKRPIFLWMMNGHPMGCT